MRYCEVESNLHGTAPEMEKPSASWDSSVAFQCSELLSHATSHHLRKPPAFPWATFT